MSRRRVLAAAALAAGLLGSPAAADRPALPAELSDLPRTAETRRGKPADPLNVAICGRLDDLGAAFRAAGWYPAEPRTFRSLMRIGIRFLTARPYPTMPFSAMYFDGRIQDLAFSRPVGRGILHRHHIRLWRAGIPAENGREWWIGAATYDAGIELTRLVHKIGSEVDAERDQVVGDLLDSSCLEHTASIPWCDAATRGRNATGDPWHTDGLLRVAILKTAEP